MKKNVILLDVQCTDCGIRLTEFEATEKQGRCMDCAKEVAESVTIKPQFSLKEWRKQRIVNV